MFRMLGNYAKMLYRMVFAPAKPCAINVDKLGWVITLPKGFHLITEKNTQRMGERYRKNLAEKAEVALKKFIVQGQFWAEFEIENKFGCTITDFDETPEPTWRNRCNETFNALLKYSYEIYKQYTAVTISTDQETRQKGDILFEVFEISAKTPSRLLHCTRYYMTTRKNHGIFITMSFAEEKVGEQMLNALRSSTFSA